jgi:predicted phage terminase large subunit-like protein
MPTLWTPPAPHHRVIQQALQDLVQTDEYDGVLIMAPPGSAKSTYGSVQFATWYFANWATHKILACSNTTALAEDFARRRRSTCELRQWELLSGTTLDPNQLGLASFGTAKGGVMYARGVGSSIAGLRCNLLLLDDAIASFEEAQSPAQLDKIWEWYMTDARTRLVPNGKEAIIMTRWSRQDPAGRILERIENGEETKRWRIIRLPMLCDDPENDPLGRKLNDPLWPDWFSDNQIADNITHPIRWPSLYQQRPVDASGTWVSEEFLHFETAASVPRNVKFVAAVDLALSTARGDYTVITIAAIDQDRNIHIIDMFREQVEVSKTLRKLTSLSEQYHFAYCLIDDDPAAKVFVESMKEFARTTGSAVRMKAMKTRGNDKEYRAAPMRDLFMQDRVFIVQSGWTGEAIREIMHFPPRSKAEHDDIVDTLALIGRDMGMTSQPKEHVTPEEKAITGAITIDENGRLTTTQTMDELWGKGESKRSFEKLRI